jgi:hypothetical protein
MILGANEAPILQLKKYIQENIPEINRVYEEWPNHNEELNMPCASVMTVGNPRYTNQMPVLWKHEAGTSYYIVGFYDINLTIDLWAEYKETRGELMERVFDLFNKQFQELGMALGISLQLEDYHNVIARYELNGYNYGDNEEASQRDEWRARLNVLVDFPRIMAKVESRMEEITVDQEVDTDIVIN